MNKPLRLGILGAANIARSFASGVAAAQDVKIVAIASRDASKAEGFAREFGIEHHFASYEAMLCNSEVDAVYVPLPNTMHAEWSIRAAAAGKHVICEKPLAMSAGEATEMFAAAEQYGVILREAYPYLAQPQTVRTRELIAEGAIGRVQLIRASFGVPFSDRSNIRLNPTLGGGSLLDAGSYPVSLCRMLVGAPPKRVQAVARWTADALDRTLVATIDFANGVLAQISCSFATAFHRHALIVGEQGVIETDYTNHAWSGSHPEIKLRRGLGFRAPYETIFCPGGDGFCFETSEFGALVKGDSEKWHGASPQDSIDIARMLDAAAISARDDGQWVCL
ncbi:Gfo/Idh/MocA family oxidoreductase [Bradyrhizobium symbiodeficiens]|uniref:Gfo/Idh/MocA family oxidoreductase n=1 Tax=Bradyrhizobium symbiodeficiens TaxID=1404367 RepID=A0ABX5W9B0_9BRAD|nr:Gfo/Idh/MocA family oxidoreductase [Bradyrhizobium symbiodeficiens]QDF38815.1 Gfo/Idh/MocA family oxidoreductase [Bradyrhizobium symbiodeficiens]